MIVNSILDKLYEYGINIHDHYEMEDEHYFCADDMNLFLNKDNILKVAFLASTKPEIVASTMLILSKIEGVFDIEIMESFVFDKKGNLLNGNEPAHEEISNRIAEGAIRGFTKDQTELAFLIESKECASC